MDIQFRGRKRENENSGFGDSGFGVLLNAHNLACIASRLYLQRKRRKRRGFLFLIEREKGTQRKITKIGNSWGNVGKLLFRHAVIIWILLLSGAKQFFLGGPQGHFRDEYTRLSFLLPKTTPVKKIHAFFKICSQILLTNPAIPFVEVSTKQILTTMTTLIHHWIYIWPWFPSVLTVLSDLGPSPPTPTCHPHPSLYRPCWASWVRHLPPPPIIVLSTHRVERLKSIASANDVKFIFEDGDAELKPASGHRRHLSPFVRAKVVPLDRSRAWIRTGELLVGYLLKITPEFSTTSSNSLLAESTSSK